MHTLMSLLVLNGLQVSEAQGSPRPEIAGSVRLTMSVLQTAVHYEEPRPP